jgi:hypothetical protein
MISIPLCRQVDGPGANSLVPIGAKTVPLSSHDLPGPAQRDASAARAIEIIRGFRD